MRTAVAVLVSVLALVSIAAAGDDDDRERRRRKATPVSVGDLPDPLIAAADVNAAVEAYLADQARLVAEYLEAMRPRIAVDWARWERLHVCEQPDSWYAYGRFGNGLRGGGGLGMSDGAWSMAVAAARARGVELPGHVLDATPEEQMTGAQAFYDAHGWAWGCRV